MSKSLEDRLAAIGDAAEAGEADQTDRPIPAHVKVTRGNPRSKVLQVRLNPEELAALEAIAERRDLPVSTVAREQLLRLVEDENDVVDPLTGLVEAAARINEYAHEVRRKLEITVPGR
nr:CopG family transcriptional regulator [Mycobacterium avium]